jgi:hypothetical protein
MKKKRKKESLDEQIASWRGKYLGGKTSAERARMTNRDAFAQERYERKEADERAERRKRVGRKSGGKATGRNKATIKQDGAQKNMRKKYGSLMGWTD